MERGRNVAMSKRFIAAALHHRNVLMPQGATVAQSRHRDGVVL